MESRQYLNIRQKHFQHSDENETTGDNQVNGEI